MWAKWATEALGGTLTGPRTKRRQAQCAAAEPDRTPRIANRRALRHQIRLFFVADAISLLSRSTPSPVTNVSVVSKRLE